MAAYGSESSRWANMHHTSSGDPFRTLRRYQLDGFSGADGCPPTLHELDRSATVW
jgi:hypothetical protein